MTNNIDVVITCPYCDHTQKYWIENRESLWFSVLITCDGDEGGCDTPFYAEIRKTYSSITRKIDGFYAK